MGIHASTPAIAGLPVWGRGVCAPALHSSSPAAIGIHRIAWEPRTQANGFLDHRHPGTSGKPGSIPSESHYHHEQRRATMASPGASQPWCQQTKSACLQHSQWQKVNVSLPMVPRQVPRELWPTISIPSSLSISLSRCRSPSTAPPLRYKSRASVLTTSTGNGYVAWAPAFVRTHWLCR